MADEIQIEVQYDQSRRNASAGSTKITGATMYPGGHIAVPLPRNAKPKLQQQQVLAGSLPAGTIMGQQFMMVTDNKADFSFAFTTTSI